MFRDSLLTTKIKGHVIHGLLLTYVCLSKSLSFFFLLNDQKEGSADELLETKETCGTNLDSEIMRLCLELIEMSMPACMAQHEHENSMLHYFFCSALNQRA